MADGKLAPKVRILGLGKTFSGDRGAIVALDGVTLDIGENELVSLVGTSGRGKSTLLSILLGLEGHDSGSLLVDSRPVTGPGRTRNPARPCGPDHTLLSDSGDVAILRPASLSAFAPTCVPTGFCSFPR
jgi:energy-coupling factor transporter ATP-binding protein EcfA2